MVPMRGSSGCMRPSARLSKRRRALPRSPKNVRPTGWPAKYSIRAGRCGALTQPATFCVQDHLWSDLDEEGIAARHAGPETGRDQAASIIMSRAALSTIQGAHELVPIRSGPRGSLSEKSGGRLNAEGSPWVRYASRRHLGSVGILCICYSNEMISAWLDERFGFFN